MSDTARPEPLGSVTSESLADQGLIYTKYQQALAFVWEGRIFNALTVLSLWPTLMSTNTDSFLPNAVGRPIRIRGEGIMRKARTVYFAACEQYDKDVAAYRNLLKLQLESAKEGANANDDSDLGDDEFR